MKDLFNEPDSPSKERVIEILILMADYLSEGEVEEFSDGRKSLYSLLIEGNAIGGLCVMAGKLEVGKAITSYEKDVVIDVLKQELLKSRGYISIPSLLGSYWFEPMTGKGSKESVVSAQSERLEFLHEVTIKLQNS